MIPNKRQTMKVKSFLVFIILFLGTFTYAQNSLKIIDVMAGPGEKSKILVELTNSDQVVGTEFTLTIPQGLIVSEKESKIIESRKGDHAIYVNIEKNNPQNYHFIILSLTSDPFKENKGTILEIPIEIPMGYTTGQTFNLFLSGVVLSSKNAVDIGSNHENGKLVIANALYPDLAVSGIVTNESTITPGGKINVSWGVNNVGERIASGGWTEQISIISEKTGLEYNLGSISYSSDLEKGKSISRNATFNLPKIIGIDGNVKIKINLIPNPSVKEPDALKNNNKLIAANTIVLEKVLYLTLDKKSIDENSTEVIRATITQSGDRSTDNTFQITASQSGQLDHPATIKIPKDQSSAVFYIKPIDNTIPDGNRKITLSLSGNNYPAVAEEIEIIDNEVSLIALTSSKTIATDGESITITLQTDFAKSKDIKFSITTDQNSRWTAPKEVTLPAGSKSITFSVEVKNNKTPEPTVTGKITTRAEAFQAGSTEIILKSSNIPAFEFEITPETISKGDGVYATYATIKRLDKSDVSVNIRLKASVANALILPELIEFPANVNQRKFNIGAVNNGIVDGTKTVEVTAEVYLPSCNCTFGAANSGSPLIKTITILDSNGPALLVKASPATLKAGQENSGKITIIRNTTDTSTAITVKLSSDAPTIISIPATATIPAGKESVEVNLSTKIDTNKIGDQTIRVQAEADNFAAGFAWLLVTDQNKPDAIISNINCVTQAAGKDNIAITTTITNQGFAVFTKGAKMEYYLSKDKSTKNGTILATAQLDEDIESGKSLDFVKSITLPELAGDYFIVVAVNLDQKLNELTYTNNDSAMGIKLLSGYTATMEVAKIFYKSGEIITFTGSAKMIDNSPAANREVEITIANGSFVRSYKVNTNSTGNFVYDFEPLQAESGHYTASAGYPGTKNAVQAEFDIIGFEWTNKPTDYLKWELLTNTTFKGEFKLKNNSKTALTGIKIELPANAGFTIQANPLTLAAGEEAVLEYTLTTDKPSEENKYYNIDFTIVSNEGAKLNALAYYYCKAQNAKITANPVSINTTMTKGSTRYYEFTITNTGAVDAEKVQLDIPNLEWMKLKGAAIIDKIAPNETATVILELTPTEKQQLNVPLTGSFAVNLLNGEGISIPFKIETVSESTGSLTIDVVDEYTYNTEKAPHLKGAKVIVRHPFSGVVLAEGLTDENGLFNTGQIPEGYYTITVTADKHNTYQNNIVVDPGKTTIQTVFISYQAISYEWTVKPTEIDDKYESELIVKFETNVPKPVVVFEFDNTPIKLESGQSYILNVAVTNYGLINALDVKLKTPEASGYTFTLLTDYIPVLSPKSSIIIPLLIQKNPNTNKLQKSAGVADCIVAHLLGIYRIICGPEWWEDIRAKVPLITEQASNCSLPIPSLPSPPSKPGNPNGGGTGPSGCSNCGGSPYTVGIRANCPDGPNGDGSGPNGGGSGPNGGGSGPDGSGSGPDSGGSGPDGSGSGPDSGGSGPDSGGSGPDSGGSGPDGSGSGPDNGDGTGPDCSGSDCDNDCTVDLVKTIADGALLANSLAGITCNAVGICKPLTDAIGTLGCFSGDLIDMVADSNTPANTIGEKSCYAIDKVLCLGTMFDKSGTAGLVYGGAVFYNDFRNYIKCAYKTDINEDVDKITDLYNSLDWHNKLLLNAFPGVNAQNSVTLLKIFRTYSDFANNCGKIADTIIESLIQDFKNSTSKKSGKSSNQEKLTEEELRNYINIWNISIDAYKNKEILQEDMIDFNELEKFENVLKETYKYAYNKGYGKLTGMDDEKNPISQLELHVLELINEEINYYNEQKNSRNSVCATVTVKFSQKMTMTREAFEGTLTMNNGSGSNTIKNVNLDLIVKDEAGNDMTHLFQINKDAFLSGTGIVEPQNSQAGIVIFIPTKETAPTVAKSYSFGGTLSYLDPSTGEKVTVQLYPVTLEVNPSPDLVLHYFMQRDIIGDDPLTEKVEPMVPAEMALLIKNEGYGLAKNVQVQSVQPEIIENKKGLLIDFEIIGSNFNNEPKQLGLLNVDFGNIEPQKAAIGQWWFTSTLLGHFVEYDLKVKHLSSFGNKDLSLIKASYVHELIKGVKAYGPGHDNIGDFLVNDISDVNDTPDAIFYSNGESDEVYKVSNASISNLISPSKLTTTLTLNSSKTGWNYGNLSDPGKDKFKLDRVVRITDNLELPIENFWQTFVTLRDGADPKYENNLHFLDKISGLEKYTLYYTTINTNVPKVISFENVPATTTKALESVQVNFNKAINPSTFTAQNIKLIHQGNQVAFNDSFIGKVNDSTYVLNIKTLALASGFYELTVQCKGIKDLDDNEGVEGKAVSWVQIIGELGIVQLKTDQTQAQPVNSIELLFNKIVKPNQFTKDKLKLNGKTLDNISIVTENNLNYTIVGLTEYNSEKAEYELTVDLPSIKADDNTFGLIVQSHKWKVDLTLPEIDKFIPQFQGAINSQNVTDMQIVLNKPLQNNFDAGWVSLYKGSVIQDAIFTVTKQDDLHYLISGLGEYTYTAGGYKVVIDQSGFTDASGNFGIGNSSTMWTVKFDKPSTPINMHITPDRGISATDNITSGNDLAINLKITANRQTVELYVITPTNRILVTNQYLETAGELNIPINGYTGKNSFEAIVYDEYGNVSDPIAIETYIDILEFDETINPIKNNSNGCSETEYLQVVFTDEITASEFTKEVLIIKAGGIVISNEKVTIIKVSDKEFRIENINKFSDDGDITFGVDLSKLHKKSSGLQGKGIVYKNVGVLNTVSTSITGDGIITDANTITTYTATPNMQNYSWTVTGGEIIEERDNIVTIKWVTKGTQELSLNYTTPESCTKTTSAEIKVEATLSIDKVSQDKKGLIIAPVPNNGTFTLFVNGEEGTFTLAIYDVRGRIVYKQNHINITDNFKEEIHTHLKTIGVYYLVLHNSEISYKSKFLLR